MTVPSMERLEASLYLKMAGIYRPFFDFAILRTIKFPFTQLHLVREGI